MSNTDEKYAWEGKGLDEVSAKELYLFIENDGDLYRQQYSPINKNLTIKKAQGVYDHDKTVKQFMYLVDNGAKRYESGGGRSGSMPSYFPKPVREAVAEELRDKFELEHELGNYDQYIPKKYLAKPATKTVKKKVVRSHSQKPDVGLRMMR